ncbi:MAG: DNA primase [Oscillospiraceae bacterium]|nr:DNA primase [Oscillospiraceae bacterium]MBQ2223422.1 DNA primase [Oscillospiraceae bacterium]MBQ5405422.1 DNA primase [Oscillospiraceae bacterium]MBR6353109.1 DNA primase [Oscillospiraceae bacterium]
MLMTIYEKAKSLVTAREAAEHYGLKVNSHGMALCPFHDDHNPSMKVDERFHCFGCEEDGDVIDFTAKFFNLTLPEAAEKLAADFGDGAELSASPAPPKPPDPAERCHDVLLALEVQLHRQKRLTAPQSMDDPITTEYAQNCQMYDFIVGLADLLSGGIEQQKEDEVSYLTDGVLDRYERILQKEVIEYADIF